MFARLVARGSIEGLPHAQAIAALFLITTFGALPSHAQAPRHLSTGGGGISPQFAEDLSRRLKTVREADGCRVEGLATEHSRMSVHIETRSRTRHVLEVAAARHGRRGDRRAGEWTLGVPGGIDRDCALTEAAIEAILSATTVPRPIVAGAPALRVRLNGYVLGGSFLLLLAGTLVVALREARVGGAPRGGVVCLALIWGAALALRLSISPRAFLHDGFHVGETVLGYFGGEIAPMYGNTGPTLFRMCATLLDRPEDVGVIFLSNAIIASLAIPALAMLVLALVGSWPQALCAAVLLAVFPVHLRFSAAEDLYVVAVTFGLWSLCLSVLYARTGRLADSLLAALALSLAMQSRPDMLLFPLAVLAVLALAGPRPCSQLITQRTGIAVGLLAASLVPHLLGMLSVLSVRIVNPPRLPGALTYVSSLTLFEGEFAPPVYWALLAVGAVRMGWHKPGLLAATVLVYAGYTLFATAQGVSLPFRLRSQQLPNAIALIIAAQAAAFWLDIWGRRRRVALVIGTCALGILAVVVVVERHAFIVQPSVEQLEWAFLEETVPRLPDDGRLLTAVTQRENLVAVFPDFLLAKNVKDYELIDLPGTASGAGRWPLPGEDLLYYEGVFCQFARGEEKPPGPRTRPCRAVHDHYLVEPLFVRDVPLPAYSAEEYASAGAWPFRIGFFRLRSLR